MPSPINSYGQSGAGVSQGGVDRTSSETAEPTDDGRAGHGAKYGRRGGGGVPVEGDLSTEPHWL